ncbi:MAG: DUF3108 domain-containing protein [Candidatus Aureabacteria bacterium]|nr:DUF3108 domain-containing protein [Candidatus Auribacterota bacterium]
MRKMNNYLIMFFILFLLKQPFLQADEWQGMKLPETAHYSISYFGVKAGNSSIKIEKIDYKGREAIKITAKVKTTKLFSMFYRVDDVMESIVDAKTLKPLEHNVDYEEGSYRRKTKYKFDYEKNECISGEGNVKINDNILDPLGALVFIRIMDLEKNKSIKRQICDGRGVQTVEANVKKKKKIATIWGWEQAYIVKPVLKDVDMKGVTKVKEKVTLYFLEKRSSLPYLVTGKLVIGSLVARLRKLEKGD